MSEQNQNQNSEQLRVGVVGKAVGLKGEVFVISHTDIPDVRFTKDAIVQQINGEVLTVQTCREHNGRLIVKFKEVNSRENAEELRNTELFANRITEDDAYYFDELIGCKVLLKTEIIGEVINVIDNMAQNLIEIRLTDGGKRVLVPFVENIVPKVNVQDKSITITPPEGLLEL